MDELEKSMSALNKGKARYPHGLCEEIFQIQVLGTNLKESLLLLLNKIKEEGVISSFMRESMVTTIPKSGSKFQLKNERGIFQLSIIRSILLRLIYEIKYETINARMSESNIGARKGKGCQNYIWGYKWNKP